MKILQFPLVIIFLFFSLITASQNWQPYYHPEQDVPLEKPDLLVPFQMEENTAFRVSDYELLKDKMYDFEMDVINIHHSYPRHHAFSKNNTYILGNSGWKRRALWKSDGTFVRQINQAGANGSTRWSNTEDEYIYIVDTDIKSFCKVNVLTDEKEVIRTFPYKIGMGKSEGSLSSDGSKVVFTSDDNGKVRLTMYNITTDTFTEKTLSRSYETMNWASVSYSGDYVLIAYDDNGKDLLLYNWSGKYIRRITRHGHGDVGFDENGDECWFGIGSNPDIHSNSTIHKFRLSDNKSTLLLGGEGVFTNGDSTNGESMSGHISAKATNVRRGVIHVSLNDPQGPYHFFTLKTDGSQEIEFWGWDNSTSSNWGPHLTPDRTGRMGVWKSNWANDTNYEEMYLVRTKNCSDTTCSNFQQIAINIYPNPAIEEINVVISNSKNYFVELYNSVGQLIKKGSNLDKINTNTLSTGIYILKVFGEDINTHRKIIVK